MELIFFVLYGVSFRKSRNQFCGAGGAAAFCEGPEPKFISRLQLQVVKMK
jgi:hypothetical protein